MEKTILVMDLHGALQNETFLDPEVIEFLL